MTSAVRAVFAVCRTSVIAEGTLPRVYWGVAPGGTALPFAIGNHVGGGAIYEHQVNDTENVRIRWIVQGSTQAEADNGADVIQTTLNIKGTQQAASALDASAYGWEIVIARKGDVFYPPVELDENREIFRAGFDIDFKCERTS